MRTRKEIESEVNKNTEKSLCLESFIAHLLVAQNEILLDIRELLAQPTLHKDFGKLLDSISTPQE